MNGKISGKDVVLPTVENFDRERPQPLLRDARCSCKICMVAKTTINSNAKKKVKSAAAQKLVKQPPPQSPLVKKQPW